MEEQTEYVTAAEALELLEVSEGKLTALLKSGELPWRSNPRNKRVKLIKRADIAGWLAHAPLPAKREIREQKVRYQVAQEVVAPWAEVVPDAPYPMTAEDFEHWPDDGRWLYELVNGRLVRMPHPGGRHGKIVAKLSAFLLLYVLQNNLGDVLAAETGFIVTQPGDKGEIELAPDVSFVRKTRAPAQNSLAEAKPWRLAPDLVAEVASPDQYRPEMAEKARLWLHAGVRLVWLVWPKYSQVDLWLPGHEDAVRTLNVGEALDGLDVVPGFSYSLAELFA